MYAYFSGQSNKWQYSFSFLCGTQWMLGQKESTKSWMPVISLSPLWEILLLLILVLSSNIYVKGDKMMRENNLVRLTFDSWCSLSGPQCAAAYRENWNSWYLYKTSVLISFKIRKNKGHWSQLLPQKALAKEQAPLKYTIVLKLVCLTDI